MKCWICGAEEAATREHLVKASDLKALFGKPSQRAPLFLSTTNRRGMPKRRNLRVGSLKSDTLKFAHHICLSCNSAVTQPYDYAWEHCSKELRASMPRLLERGVFRANWLFPYDTRRAMRGVHLYFTKLFGCLVVEGGIPIDTAPLAEAIMSGKPHPNLYLAFGQMAMPVEMAGGSNVVMEQMDGETAFATWFYSLGDLVVNVMYALPGERRQGLEVAWHPRMGSQCLRFTQYE